MADGDVSQDYFDGLKAVVGDLTDQVKALTDSITELKLPVRSAAIAACLMMS